MRIKLMLARLFTVGFLVSELTAVSSGSVEANAAVPPCQADGYPPRVGATIESSTTTPVVGVLIEVAGAGFCGREAVTITLRSSPVGYAETSERGIFDPQITVTGPDGPAQLCAFGASELPTDRSCMTLQVKAASSVAMSGHAAFTGLDLAALLSAALAALGLGTATIAVTRRRRNHHALANGRATAPVNDVAGSATDVYR